MGRQLPASVTWAIRVQVVLVLVSGVITALTAVRRDVLVAAWNARQVADIEAPAFVPVAVVLFVTFALLVAVLTAFFRDGHPAARVSLAGLALFFLFTMFVLVQQRPPVEFVVAAVVAGLLDLVLLFFLFHRDTHAWVRGAELAEQTGQTGQTDQQTGQQAG